MANAFKSYITDNVGVTPSAVYTAPALTTATIIGLSCANQLASQVYVDVTLTKGATTVYMVKGAPVPVGSSLVVIGGDQKTVINAGDIVNVVSDTAASIDVVVSVLEIS